MKYSKRMSCISAALGMAVLQACAVSATESDATSWDASGFGSVGVARSTLSEARYRLAPSY